MLAESQQGHQQIEEPLVSRLQLQEALTGDRKQGGGRRGGRKGVGEFVQVSSAVETEKGWGGLHRRRESPPLGSESLADR